MNSANYGAPALKRRAVGSAGAVMLRKPKLLKKGRTLMVVKKV
jgi:hypothetical protein